MAVPIAWIEGITLAMLALMKIADWFRARRRGRHGQYPDGKTTACERSGGAANATVIVDVDIVHTRARVFVVNNEGEASGHDFSIQGGSMRMLLQAIVRYIDGRGMCDVYADPWVAERFLQECQAHGHQTHRIGVSL